MKIQNSFKKKEYTYDRSQKKAILESCARNDSNLLLDAINAYYYIETAITEYVQCKINGIQY